MGSMEIPKKLAGFYQQTDSVSTAKLGRCKAIRYRGVIYVEFRDYMLTIRV